MSHVLLGGDEQQMAELCPLLVQWGVTVGHLRSLDHVPTVRQCDVVIWLGHPEEYQDACLGAVPDGSGGAVGSAAPLIFVVGDGGSAELMRPGCSYLGDIGVGGKCLRPILRDILVQARVSRENRRGTVFGKDEDEVDTYLDFLGHELRSPLTAIKTALEVIGGEPEELETVREASGHKMLDIALRNVRRLQQTVDWSQDLLAAGSSATVVCPRTVTVGDLAAELAQVGAVHVGLDCGERALETDPELVRLLVVEMARVVSMACPTQGLVIELNACLNELHLLELVVTVARPVVVGDTGFGQRARFLTSPRLMEILGVRLHAEGVRNDRPAVSITFNTLHDAVLSPC